MSRLSQIVAQHGPVAFGERVKCAYEPPPNSCHRWLNRVAVSAVATLTLVTFAAAAAPTGRQTLMYQGIERSYVVRLPGPGLASDRRLPLVLVLHGGAGDAATIEAVTGFTDKARLEKFIVVYPEGSGRFGHKLLTWNAGHCCGYAMEKKVDDTGFILALIDRLTADYPVDPRRIYATGMSNGGMMTHRLGIELSDRIAAIAPVAAAVFGDERKPANPVPALMINGRLDTAVPPAGGAPGGRFPGAWDGVPVRPALAQGSFWAAANGCDAGPDAVRQESIERWRYRCPPARDVEVVLVGDSGHAWPGAQSASRRGNVVGPSDNGWRATDAIWSFFQSLAK